MGGVVREQRTAPMHSPVSWALLGLIIERPSYAYAVRDTAAELRKEFGDHHLGTFFRVPASRAILTSTPGGA
jgi:hypothetical protein